MSEQDSLKLAAEIVDKFSGPLREMTKSVHSFDDMLKGHQVRSNKETKEQVARQKELNEQFGETAKRIAGSINPAFSEMSLSVVGVAASIGALIGQLKEAGDSFYKFQNLSARTGMPIDDIKARTLALEGFGVSAEQAAASWVALGDSVAKLRRGFSPEIQRWESTFTNLGPLIQRIQAAKSQAAAEDMAIDFVIKQPNVAPDQKAKFLSDLLHITPDIAEGMVKDYYKRLGEAQKAIGEHPTDMNALGGLNDAFWHLKLQIIGVKESLVEAFGGPGAAGIERFAGVIHSEAEDFKYLVEKAIELNTWLDKIGGHGDIVGETVTKVLHPTTAVEKLAEKYPWLKNFSDDNLAKLFGGAAGNVGGAGGPGATFNDRWASSSDSQKTMKLGVKEGVIEGLQEYNRDITGTGGGGAGGAGGGGGGGRRSLGARLGIDHSSGRSGGRGGGGGGGEVPAGNGPSGGGVSGNKRETAKIIADEWRNAGMSNEGIAGLMANVQDESNFNSGLRHPDQPHFGGEAHFAHGLYQEGGTEWNHYAAWLAKHYPGADWRDARLQSRFAAENLKKNYPATWAKMNKGNRYQAGAAYVDGYLKPAANFRAGRINKYLHGGVAPLEKYTGPERNLLSNANKAGVNGDPQKVEGDASVRVAFENMPSGAKAYMQHGGMFKQGTVDWGTPMPSSNPGGASFNDRWPR
jgi:hypothetical protein